jgi:hypothetical protein
MAAAFKMIGKSEELIGCDQRRGLGWLAIALE